MKEVSENKAKEIINQYTAEIAKMVHEKKVMTNIDLVKLNRINIKKILCLLLLVYRQINIIQRKM